MGADVAGPPPDETVAVHLAGGLVTGLGEPEEVEIVEFAAGLAGGEEGVLGDAVAVVGLEDGGSGAEEVLQFFPPPVAGGGVGKVDHADGFAVREAGETAARGAEQVTMIAGVVVDGGAFGDVGIDPETGLEATTSPFFPERGEVRERGFVSLEVAGIDADFEVVVRAHPERVEVDDIGGDAALAQAVHRGFGLGLVLVLAARHPDAERPTGRHRGSAGERGVTGDKVFQVGAGEEKEVESAVFAEQRAGDVGKRADLPERAKRAVEK